MPFVDKINRKHFLKTSFLASGFLMFLINSCKNESIGGAGEGTNGYNFGTGDIALLNYAYVLSQLQAGFYTQLIQAASVADQKALLSDILKHETAQREFLKTALGSNALPAMVLDFSSINFASRSTALQSALFFEDLSVQAMNGLTRDLQAAAFITIMAEIISVQARHASYIHELIQPGSFTGVLDASGMEVPKKPAQVLALLQGIYIKTKLDAGSLPAS